MTRARAPGADGSVRARPTAGAVITLAGSLAHMETTSHRFGSSGPYSTVRLTVDLEVARTTTVQLYAYTARSLLSLFASYAVGAAPRDDAPVPLERPARIF